MSEVWESLPLVVVAGGAALATGLVGAVVLTLLRRSSFALQVLVVALTSVAAVGVGVVAAGRAMILTEPAVDDLRVVLVAAALVGVLVASVLARRVGVESRSLGEVARRIGGDEPASGGAVSVREFKHLADQLAETDARLAEARQRERAVESARRELVSWVSHDLRTPLAGIRAIAEALEDEVATDPAVVRRFHRTLRTEADRLAVLVEDLFELSRLHAGALPLPRERVGLGDLVSDAVAAAEPVARAKGVRLQATGLAQAPALEVSASAVARVLQNLLENAVRETPAPGAVEVGVAVDGDAVAIRVVDGCGGIPAAHLARVFDMGFRGESARTPRDDGGAGLGLAIAHELVAAHGGTLTVENVQGGCCFEVRLPR